MKLPVSWLKEYVDCDLDLVTLARTLTMVGLEVEEIQVIGLALPAEGGKLEFKISGLEWARDKFVVAQIDEVMVHPNADRLTLCRLNDGTGELIVLTGAPNLFEFKGTGPLAQPLKVAYAREGARLYDGHADGLVLTTLKRAKIRGVDSFSMVCSEKELGISDEHEGILLLDAEAPTGMPLMDYMGDAVLEINILPNMIRNASVVGIARELAAATGKNLRAPSAKIPVEGEKINGAARIEIGDASLNPRFVLGLVRGVDPKPSPEWVQRRLRLAGMRPINAIVDATNYVMLETGQPLHAFDYDVLVKRAGGKTPTINTRAAKKGEKLTTLDGVERTLEDYTVLVCDEAGALSIAGVMGGLESEVTPETRTVLLEGASWNYVNVRRTMTNLHLNSEAGYRFGRGVHPALAEQGVRLCLARLADWAGGTVADGLIDEYPQVYVDPTVELSTADVKRLLGVELSAVKIAKILTSLEFTCRVDGNRVFVKAPAARIDIGEGVVGRADLIEEIARLYGYDNIPETRLSSSLPPAYVDSQMEGEERLQDILARLGLQEVINYRLTSTEREARLTPPGQELEAVEYVRLANALTPERSVMRRSLLASVLDLLERNSRLRERLAFFEVGKVFLPVEGERLPAEPTRLAIALTGKREASSWDAQTSVNMNFFDLKGMIEGLLEALHISGAHFVPGEGDVFHPGKCARLMVGELELGRLGELHPLVKERYDFGAAPVLAAELDAEALLALAPHHYPTQPVPTFPPVLEDLAVVVDENLPAERVEGLIRQSGGKLLVEVKLFDIFRGEQIGVGKKSLAYALTYQAPDRTLKDEEIKQLRGRIIRRLDQDLGAKIRS